MKKFVFLFKGGKSPMDATPEEMKEIGAQWKAWFGELAEYIADGGAPFGPQAKSVTSTGADDMTAHGKNVGGYTIINASNLDEATELAKGCPSVVNNEEGAEVQVFEAMPM